MRYRMLWAVLLVCCVYAPVLRHLLCLWLRFPQFSDGVFAPFPQFSHGVFVPFLSLFVIYRERKKLRSITSCPSWTGILIALVGLLMLSIGVLWSQYFLSRISLLIVLMGVIVLFEGWALFRAVLFPWAFLVLMFPIPVRTGARFDLALESLSGNLAARLLNLGGVPALLENNIVVLGDGGWAIVCVAGPLLFLLTLTIIYGYFADDRTWVRVVLPIFVVPVEVVRGSFVIVLVAFCAGYTISAAEVKSIVMVLAWLSFFMALLMLFLLQRLISFVSKRSSGGAPPTTVLQLEPEKG